MVFHDRIDAGKKLAQALERFRGRDCIVLALPRGGVPIAAEVARSLSAPLDLLMVRKIGVPGHEELAMGAVVDDGAPIVIRDAETMRMTGTSQSAFDRICMQETQELARRRKLYLGDSPRQRLEGRIAILVDDGLATGNTMRAALIGARERNPALLVMAVPVAPAATLKELAAEADEVVCLATPQPFYAVGMAYEDFSQTSDADVIRLLAASEHQNAVSIS